MGGDTTRITFTGAGATVLSSLALLPAYEGQGWFWPALLTVSLVAVVGLAVRRLGVPTLLVPLAQLAALGWAYLLVFARDELRFGFLPSTAAVDALDRQIDGGLAAVVQHAAPLPGGQNVVLVTALGVGLTAIAVDTIAATFRLVPWAGLPLLLPYIVPATTVSGGLSELAFAPVAVGYLLMLTSEGRERRDYWGRPISGAEPTNSMTAPDVRPGRGTLLGRASRLASLAVIGLAILVPMAVPALPDSMLGIRLGADSGGPRGAGPVRVDNPITDLKRDLEQGADVTVLTYQTDGDPDQLGYIRMVVLDQFDGQQWWPSPRAVRPPNGSGHTSALPEPPGLSSTVPRHEITTRFQLTDKLESTWLPAFYPPTSVTGIDDWVYAAETLELLNRGGSSAGLDYQVTSLSIPYRSKDLADAGPPPAELRDRYLDLPSATRRQVHDIAARVTGDADRPYQRAVALQEWFRTEFEYSVEVQRGHSDSALMEFLADRTGYCEQFAAAMAIMARTQGIPARVAVGYTPGEPVGERGYEVTSHDAHAWPELYFDGYGWVPFEPTPGDRIPDPPRWSDPDRQDDPSVGRPGDPPSDPAEPDERPTSTPAPDPGGGQPPPESGDAGTGGRTDPLPFTLAGLALLVLATPGTARALIRRARLAPTDPDRLVSGCWRELAASVRDLGLVWEDAATPRAARRRLAGTLTTPEATAALERAVQTVERTWYSARPADPETLVDDTRTVLAALRAQSGPLRRIQARLLPPSLWNAVTATLRRVGRTPDWTNVPGLTFVRGVVSRRWRAG